MTDANAFQTHYLYDGEVELLFSKEDHVYKVDGEQIDNVTAITDTLHKPALVGWAAKLCGEFVLEKLDVNKQYSEDELGEFVKQMKASPFKVKRKAADLGTDAHEWCERYIINIIDGGQAVIDLPTYPPARRAIEAFLDWERRNKVEYLHAERKVFSRKHRFCGTTDIVARVNNRLTLIDIKTSNSVYSEFALQTGAYVLALNEEMLASKLSNMEQVEDRIILKLGKEDGEFRAYPLSRDRLDADIDGFLALQRVYQWTKRHGKLVS